MSRLQNGRSWHTTKMIRFSGMYGLWGDSRMKYVWGRFRMGPLPSLASAVLDNRNRFVLDEPEPVFPRSRRRWVLVLGLVNVQLLLVLVLGDACAGTATVPPRRCSLIAGAYVSRGRGRRRLPASIRSAWPAPRA